MNNIRIIQTSPNKTGSLFLFNLLYGFMMQKNNNFTKYNCSKISKDIIKNNLIINSNDINIDSWINLFKEYDLYFICSERDNNIINKKFKKYPNVLCINYNEFLETNSLKLNIIIDNLFNKIRKFLPIQIKMNKNNGLSRINLKTNKILYVHFHKCAGTSIISKIKNKYNSYKPCDGNCNPKKKNSNKLINFSSFDTIDLYEFLLSKNFDFFCLEFSFFNNKVIIPSNLKIYTILRSAYSRLISNYLHDTSLIRTQSAINRGYKIQNIKKFQKININYKNTKINLFNKNNYYIKFLNGLTSDKKITKSHYEYALSRINKFSYVAILENKNNLNKLMSLLEVDNKKIILNKNKSKRKNNNIKIKNFNKNNSYDILLYNNFIKKNNSFIINNNSNNKMNRNKNNNNYIPFIIHQTWKTKNLKTYSDGKTGVISQSKWKKLYPDFKYMFWTDKDINNYINKQSSDIIDTFNKLNKNIKKMDFFRYLILYEYGGIYSDLDFIPNKKIPKKIFKNKNFVGYKANRSPNKKKNKKNHNKDKDGYWVLGQAFFACKKKFVGIKLIIDNIIKTRNSNSTPLNHTGPEKLNKLFSEAKLLNDKKVLIFSKKLMDNDKGIYGYHLRHHQW